MQSLRLGLIKFEQEIVGIAFFNKGYIVSFLHDQQALEQKIKEKYKDIYVIPENFGAQFLMCTEKFWNDMYTNTPNAFILYEKTRDYTEKEFNDLSKDIKHDLLEKINIKKLNDTFS